MSLNAKSRTFLIFLSALLVAGCGSKQVTPETAPDIRFGRILEKEVVDSASVEKHGGNTRVYASVSSGGRVSIGVGFLIGLFSSNDDDVSATRYQVGLLDGGEVTIYHDSPHFELDDCVRITMPDSEDDDEAPQMERSKGAC